MSILIVLALAVSCSSLGNAEVSVFTVATDNTHGLQRFIRSAKVYNVDVQVLGMGQKWNGGDMNFAGGGQKINLLKEALSKIEPDPQHVIIFTDSYDVMYLGSTDEIINKFTTKFPEAKILFSAEPYCWPDTTLASKYPNTDVPNPFLNSGGFIGYLPQIKEMLDYTAISDKQDDQLYYTNIFLNEDLRKSLAIELDYNSSIFQNLGGALSDVELKINETETWPYIENVATQQRPLVVHGNGPSKLTLNYLGNYLAQSWSLEKGCVLCEELKIELKEDNMPHVMLAVYIEQATPFMEEFLQQLLDIDYPKSRLHLFIRNNVKYHEDKVEEFYQKYKKDYATAKRIKPSDFIPEAEARNIALERAKNSVCDYMFAIDSVARLEKFTLMHLIQSGYDVVAPMLVRPGLAWSNFWGAINNAGYYARSTDYMDIVNQSIKGIWNVPFITNCYLMKVSVLRTAVPNSLTYLQSDIDPDMAFCASLRNSGIFMYVSNELEFGHLINPENFDASRTNPDIYQVKDNRIEWEARYLNKEYHNNFLEENKPKMVCPDVYWFPLVNDRFCDEWVEVMENFGQWSDGSNSDKRLEGGYEAVPTRDIHMTQVGLERQWLYILKEYVRPLQEMVFTGYFHDPPVSIMNFVVRYRPDEQPSLRPHHDSSTYTINVALNTPLVDYEGGGCRFIRYNCSVVNTKKGWMLMHPGRLTHFHEGLRVTKGTRYIMISFVDP